MPKPKKENVNKKKKSFDFILIVTVFIMLSLGIVMVLSASSPSALSKDGDSYSYVKTQAGAAVIGLVFMYIISRIDYKIYKKFDKIVYVVCLLLLLAVLIPGVRWEAGGAARWIVLRPLGNMTFQPSEIAKLGVVLFFASYLTNNRDKLDKLWDGFFKPIIVYFGPIALVLLGVQSHLSATVVIMGVIAIMMIAAGSKFKYFAIFGTLGAGIRRKCFIYTCKIFSFSGI